jgi:hypothetical protein
MHRALVKFQTSPEQSSSVLSALHLSSSSALRTSATQKPTSPALRPTSRAGMTRCEACSRLASTSRTVWPLPVPALVLVRAHGLRCLRRLTKIVRAEWCLDASSRRRSQCCDVSSSKIYNMNEVSNGCSIGCVPIGTEDVQDWSCSCEHSRDHRNQVARLLSGIFTQNTRFMTTHLVTIVSLQR